MPTFPSKNSDAVALLTALYHHGDTSEPDEHLQELLAENASNPAMLSMAFMTAMVLQQLPSEVAERFLQMQGLWTSQLDAHFAELEAWVNWRPPKRRLIYFIGIIIVVSFLNTTFVMRNLPQTTPFLIGWMLVTVAFFGVFSYFMARKISNHGRPSRPDLPDISQELSL